MKYKLRFISVLVLVVGMLLSSCVDKESYKNTNEPQSVVLETESKETVLPSNEEVGTFDTSFEANSEMQMAFLEEVRDNPIDFDYASNSVATTTLEMRQYQEKYTDIWLAELLFSCESYVSLLNDADRENFLRLEESWENNLLEEFKFVSGVVNNPDYNLHMGSHFPLERNVEYLQMIRARTLYVKYLQFVFEFSSENNADVKVEFKYTAE
ncbi:MAG: hypothetical protein E7580_07675 [Ruminococcaceae bacterium]|nr:hypothetical protein [Oscillospiraceae bacterium]